MDPNFATSAGQNFAGSRALMTLAIAYMLVRERCARSFNTACPITPESIKCCKTQQECTCLCEDGKCECHCYEDAPRSYGYPGKCHCRHCQEQRTRRRLRFC